MKLTTRTECEEVIRRIEAGDLYREIARDYGMSVSGVMKLARKVGLRRYPF
jgi:cytidylate kinase